PPLKGHNWAAVALAFSRDDKLLFSGSLDKTLGVWDVARNVELQPVAYTAPIFAVAVSLDDQQLATGSYSPFIRIVDPATRKELANLPGLSSTVVGLDYFRDAKRPRLGSIGLDGYLRVWDTSRNKQLFALPAHAPLAGPQPPPWPPPPDFDAHLVAVGPRGKAIATAGKDGTVKVWDVAAAKTVS